ncbi:hypothetical protein CALVIDRAFT_603221 [Calocera viscosa TUFC12733]|uniref:HNH nuclease domain-containing protein n=1 Tax=Calocera viscosa (strain TUFC12733) TaxID=1330018 RepID=A0A167G1J6_CALVF|nr:hypothetical protein CALVIDRAFT_603221 [Calocera viscosa TUFC12733]
MLSYQLCVRKERETQDDTEASLARMLGYIMLKCPPSGLSPLADDINSSEGEDRDLFYDLAKYWKDCFLGVWTRLNVTPASTPGHPTRSSATLTTEEVKMLVTAGPLSYSYSKTLALQRDHHCCIFTGHLDVEAPEDTFIPGEHKARCPVELCHVWPRGLLSKLDQGAKLDWSAACITLLGRFMGETNAAGVTAMFNGDNVHALPNVFIAQPTFHKLYDQLSICLEETSQEHVYSLTAVRPYVLEHHLVGKEINLTSSDPDLPSVDPRLLSLQRAVAYVLRLSGAGELLEKEERDREPDNRHELPAGGGKHSREWALFQSQLAHIRVHYVFPTRRADAVPAKNAVSSPASARSSSLFCSVSLSYITSSPSSSVAIPPTSSWLAS